MKTIWIINQYASDPATGIGGRHHYLASALARRGYRVILVVASWHHLLRDHGKSRESPEATTIDGYTLVRISVPSYAHAHSKGRIRNWFIFRSRLWSKLKKFSAPDAILYSSPGLIAFPAAAKLARHFKARLAFEVRDIWPLSLTEVGGLSAGHPLIRYMQRIEDSAYKVCDVAISNLSHAEVHMRSRGLPANRFHFIPNGFSHAEVSNPDPLPEAIKAQVPLGKFIIGYTGTLGVANRSNVLLSAAEILKDDTGIAFVLVGDGKEKPDLLQKAKDKSLNNITFIDPIPKKQVQSMLQLFDACYVGASSSPLYRFGIAANKIYDYLYAGCPIVLSYSGAGDPATDYGAGFIAPADDPQSLAALLQKIKNLPSKELEEMGKRSHRVAVEHYNYDNLAEKLEKALIG